MSFLLAWLTTLCLAQLSHYALPHELQPKTRSLQALLLQNLLFSTLYSLIVLISLRPWLSALLSIVCAVILLVINQAKYKALREPLVFSDWYLYIQVLTHPRLFLPFLNIPITVSATLSGLIILQIIISFEDNLSFYYTIYLSPFALAQYTLISYLSKRIVLSFDLIVDIRKYGFFNSLTIYAIQSKHEKYRYNLIQYIEEKSYNYYLSSTKIKSDIICIQTESFFDARRLYSDINENLYKRFDILKKQAILSGKLVVPAWGANTLRSEFSFLTGKSNDLFQHYRFNPYQFLQETYIPSLASFLKEQGYTCIAIHPNDASFFKRNKVFPNLGFDHFLDIAEFHDAGRQGPYISDKAVQQKIVEILEKRSDNKPLFIFAITMENHGPLHLESFTQEDIDTVYNSGPPKNHHDLTVYLKHIKNADQMLFDLSDYLKQQKNDIVLCWYGDHVPSMPDVYKELDFNDGRTDYLIWHNKSDITQATEEQDLPIERLSFALLEAAGFTNSAPSSNNQTTQNTDAVDGIA